jgi:hypothetical protein
MWAALAFDLLFNNASFMLYAGQEAGEDAAEGDDGRTSIFDWCKPRSLQELFSYVHGGEMSAGPREVLSRYKELVTLSCRPAFRTGGSWDLCYCNLESDGFNPDRHFAFMRFDAGSAWLVFCNFSHATAMATIHIPDELRFAAGISQGEALVSAPPKGYALLKCK